MILSLKNITKSFGEKMVLSDFSYDFNDRDIYAIAGHSGVGKTTLLRIICGLDRKYSGEVCKKEDAKISVAFQEHRLFNNLTALQNLLEIVYDKPTESDASDAKEMLHLLGFTDEEMNLYPGELSGGMKQRISLARAFLRDCDILLLDEPTKELDAGLVKQVLDIISTLASDRLVIIVTHNMDDVDYLSAKVIDLK